MASRSDGGTGSENDTGLGIPLATSAVNYPTVYSDGCWFASTIGGTVRMTFLENIFEPQNSMTPGIKARHVGTLVMPVHAFEAMVDYLNAQRLVFREIAQNEAQAAVDAKGA